MEIFSVEFEKILEKIWKLKEYSDTNLNTVAKCEENLEKF